MTAILECRELSIRYGDVDAVVGVDLTVDPGETVALFGPSGAGKSTILYAVAGFVPIARGSISIGGGIVSTPERMIPPEQRPIGLVFQNYALWPHMTTLENVAYPFRRSGHSRADSTDRARTLMSKVGIADLAERKPAELSGGQQQRVGLARALARSADLYLFDEPTAHLDAPVRAAVAEEIRARREELGAAAIYATHDSGEALAIADRIVILRDGSEVQTGSPAEVYERPADEWAARITGPVSAVTGEVSGVEQGKLQISLGSSTIQADFDAPAPGGRVRVLIRPEWVSPRGPIHGRVASVAFRGPHTDYLLATEHGELMARVPGSPALRAGERSSWSIRGGWVPTGSGAE
jgi:ABC-type Fe3+/spermidine/putrescine transport system ATPase subunit